MYANDTSLAYLYVDLIPPPRNAAEYVRYICGLEGIHPARITLFDSPDPGNSAGELHPIKDPQAPISGASATEETPLMLKVSVSGCSSRGDLVEPPPTWVGRAVGVLMRTRFQAIDEEGSVADNERL